MYNLEQQVLDLREYLRSAKQQAYMMVDFFRDKEQDRFEYWCAKWGVYREVLEIVDDMAKQ